VLLVDAAAIGTPGRSTHEITEEEMDGLARVVQRWRTDGTAESTGSIASVVVDADTLMANSFELTPRRYLTEEVAVDLHELREAQRSARAEAATAAREVQVALDALADADAAASRSAAAVRLRLGEVAEIFRPRNEKSQGASTKADAGDLVLTTTADGFTARLLGEGDEVSGLHAIVIRALPDGPVTPEWLLLWSRTDAFARLAERFAKGSTLRSLSVKDVAEFELDVPPPEDQQHGAHLLEGLDRLAAAQAQLERAIENLRSSELRRAYSEAAG
jgi:hypothetical protein